MMTYGFWCAELERRRVAVRNKRNEMNRNSEGYKKKSERMVDDGVIAVLSRKEWRSIVQWRVMRKRKMYVERVWRERVDPSVEQGINDKGVLGNDSKSVDNENDGGDGDDEKERWW